MPPGLKLDANGGLTIYIQTDSPGEGNGSELVIRAKRSVHARNAVSLT